MNCEDDDVKKILLFQEDNGEPFTDEKIQELELHYTTKLQEFFDCKVKVCMFPNNVSMFDLTPPEKKGFE